MDLIRPQPLACLSARAFVRQDPQRFGSLGKYSRAQSLDVLKSRNPRNFLSAKDPPKQYHRSAIWNGDVSANNRLSIRHVSAKPCETGPGGRSQEAAPASHLPDRIPRAPIEEINSEDLLFGHEPKR